ncbi:hypothetical protein DOTSEDRAFT_73058 [Dothistroma septosporum NZE10]|uniref:Zn(2)-C6 fungal-type domain-containing protein n=1 Tax=Dothistroma septosporum (strain NZE10 / CBS 128990) TaxID=675120 RepID=N1PJ53_DOTSN|nr:hypothetical protein DOTSEDRAFT_73058 [Dothistroma septosporum NZE10]
MLAQLQQYEDKDGRPAPKRARSSMSRPSISETPVQDSHTFDMQNAGDPLDYPRRRAVIACEVCRSRKSRCDGGRPKCKLCAELSADCVYREPGIKLDAGDKLILERLAHIEGLLQSGLLQSPTSRSGFGGPISPATSNTASNADAHTKRMTASVVAVPMTGIGATLATNISTMPKAHTTPALHLLQWPIIRDLVSKQCDPQVLLQLEMARPPLQLHPPYQLDLDDDVHKYTKAFFEKVNVWYACVSPYSWHSYYRTASAAGFQSGAEACVVLLVLALGQAAHTGQSVSRLAEGEAIPGLEYFSAAWTVLPGLMIRNDVQSTQCHILAAAYLLYIVRPLEAWNMLCNASMKLQLLLSAPSTIAPQVKELSERVYWNALMIESDLLAELDLPHSGIVQFEESMRLPRSFPYDATVAGSDELPGNDELWYFLAEIALRRLLNRVSHVLYSHKRNSIASLEPIVAELDFQLAQWYESLPPSIRFPRERIPARDQVQTVLRLRYFACRTIIFRPYILAVLQDEGLAHEVGVQAACEKCLESCVRQLQNVMAHHAGHLPYLWQGALSITSQTLLLMGTTLSPVLSSLLPPKQQIDAVISDVVLESERLAHLAPSLRLCADVIREAEERRQLLMQRPR